jgi:hypothetical protein
MSQEKLDFGRLYKVADATRHLYRRINDCVDVVGILTAAGACGIDRSDLRRSLDRDGRRLAVEHALSIAAVSSVDMGGRIAQAFVEPLGFEIAEPAAPMTDNERAARLEVALRQLGPVGEQALRNALKGR